MVIRLRSIHIRNYRSLANVELELRPVNVLFGPSGAGKSSLLDAIAFVRDCVDRNVAFAAAQRDQGVGLLYEKASAADPIELTFCTDNFLYELTLNLASGRIDGFAGERLTSVDPCFVLLDRPVGSRKAEIYDGKEAGTTSINLPEPERLVLTSYISSKYFDVRILRIFLHSGRHYNSRALVFPSLRHVGSGADMDFDLAEQGSNLWSVLRNIESRRLLDERYRTIMKYMSEAFPTFQGLVIEQVGPSSLYARFLELGKKNPILASGISDGHLQFLALLTILFGEEPEGLLVLLDEPETSLHPWALAVLARAIREATTSWGRQVMLATHAPVLISQFEPEELLAVESKDGRTAITRLSEIENIQDLLQNYAAGSLYMSEVVAPQSLGAPPPTSGQ